MSNHTTESNDYLDTLCDKHEVSRPFLEALRPAVERIFNDVPQERRSEILALLDRTVERQAETEVILGQASAQLEQLRALNRKDGICAESRRSRKVVHQESQPTDNDAVGQVAS